MWNLIFSITRNLRLIIGFLSKYMINQRQIDLNVRRMSEALAMKLVLLDIYHLWTRKGLPSPECTKETARVYLCVPSFEIFDRLDRFVSDQRYDDGGVVRGVVAGLRVAFDEGDFRGVRDRRTFFSTRAAANPVDIFTQAETADSRRGDITTAGVDVDGGTAKEEEDGLDLLFRFETEEAEQERDRVLQFIMRAWRGELKTAGIARMSCCINSECGRRRF